MPTSGRTRQLCTSRRASHSNYINNGQQAPISRVICLGQRIGVGLSVTIQKGVTSLDTNITTPNEWTEVSCAADQHPSSDESTVSHASCEKSATHLAATTTADRTVPPSVKVPHHATALRTLDRAVTQCRAHGARLDWLSYSWRLSNNLRNLTVTIWDKTKNNIICILLCLSLQQSYSIPHYHW